MTTIGYIRVSTEQQDLDKQRHLLLDYAHRQQIHIDEFIAVEMSSRKNQDERRITELGYSKKITTQNFVVCTEDYRKMYNSWMI